MPLGAHHPFTGILYVMIYEHNRNFAERKMVLNPRYTVISSTTKIVTKRKMSEESKVEPLVFIIFKYGLLLKIFRKTSLTLNRTNVGTEYVYFPTSSLNVISFSRSPYHDTMSPRLLGTVFYREMFQLLYVPLYSTFKFNKRMMKANNTFNNSPVSKVIFYLMKGR